MRVVIVTYRDDKEGPQAFGPFKTHEAATKWAGAIRLRMEVHQAIPASLCTPYPVNGVGKNGEAVRRGEDSDVPR